MAAMITTVDNPYDPRTHYDQWMMWDVQQGYNTCSYLARVASVATEMPQIVQDTQIEQAIDEIIAMHAGGLYKKLPLGVAA